jgi:uncharacterized protein (TIGR03435 family)
MKYQLWLRRGIPILLVNACALCATPAIFAQVAAVPTSGSESGTAKLPEFEVATIKPVDMKPGGHVGPETFPGGRVDIGYASLKNLVMFAFDVSMFQVTVPEKWMDDSRFNLVAIPPDDSPARKLNPPEFGVPMNIDQRQMLQSLLISRFGLKYHVESKDGLVYFLEKSKSGLTKAVKPSDPKDKDKGTRMIVMVYCCGDEVKEQFPLYGRNTSMAYTARRLTDYLHHPVIDMTGIEGDFDFDVPGISRADFSESTDWDSQMSTAIFGEVKQLGLTLRAGKGPVQTIVVDSATQPTEN